MGPSSKGTMLELGYILVGVYLWQNFILMDINKRYMQWKYYCCKSCTKPTILAGCNFLQTLSVE